MHLGGVERSLLGFLDAINYNNYEVDVFIHNHTGELMKYMNPNANLLDEVGAYTTLTRPIFDILKEGYLKVAFGRLKARLKAKKLDEGPLSYSIFQYIADNTVKYMPQISNKEYDLAISFLTPHNIVKDKVNAKKKVAWIHTDYSTISIDAKAELPIWSSFDYIAAISESSKGAFDKLFPSLQKKVVVIENMLSMQFVKEQAMEETITLGGQVTLLTVGRFSHPKAFDRAVYMCAHLIKMGVPLKWYAIGYGDQETIEKAIEKAGMQEHFIILGKKANPYPYMRACDIYVQPSRYEGKAVTVREAQMLSKPVAITNFPTSQSQLTDSFDGIIVPMDIKGAAEGIKKLIEDEKLQNKLVENCNRTDYGNFEEINKVYNFLS